jgi:hypothetical protein
MDWLTIEGVKPYDGRYEFDLVGNELTTREWGWIKRHSGYLPLTITDGWDGSDPELFAVFAVIALHRAGRVQTRDVAEVYERIADAPFGSTIGLESDSVEDGDVDPPALRTIANEPSSGEDSPMSSERSETRPNDSGTSGSDTSESASARSAI